MPRSTDYPDPSSTLPPPELNPLLNPVLGKNLGRWAEVYFTAPPERREEAVLELLRELQGEIPRRSAGFGAQERSAERITSDSAQPSLAAAGVTEPDRLASGDMEAADDTADDEEPESPARTSPKLWPLDGIGQGFVTCESCSARVPEEQNFCGACGASLRRRDFGEGREEQDWADATGSEPQFTESSAPELRREEPARFYSANLHSSGLESAADIESREHRFQVEGDGPKLFPEYAPVPYRYQRYVGAALAIGIVALVTMAWRGTQLRSGDEHSLPQAAPVAAPSPASTPPAQAPVKAERAPAAEPSRYPANAAREPRTNNTPDVAKPDISEPEKSVISQAATKANDRVPATGQESGLEELRVAQGYLNGTQGKMRDSGEAARWLWQAVRKENSAATLLLSDLYLRGDGVPKSCDQGRLLLDAAARKGAPGAGQRLRNLQAFGCQ